MLEGEKISRRVEVFSPGVAHRAMRGPAPHARRGTGNRFAQRIVTSVVVIREILSANLGPVQPEEFRGREVSPRDHAVIIQHHNGHRTAGKRGALPEVALAQSPHLGVVANDRKDLPVAAGRERHREFKSVVPGSADVGVYRFAPGRDLILTLPQQIPEDRPYGCCRLPSPRVIGNELVPCPRRRSKVRHSAVRFDQENEIRHGVEESLRLGRDDAEAGGELLICRDPVKRGEKIDRHGGALGALADRTIAYAGAFLGLACAKPDVAGHDLRSTMIGLETEERVPGHGEFGGIVRMEQFSERGESQIFQ